MLNLPQQTLNKIKKALTKQKADVEQQLSKIDSEDPLLVDAPPESSESGTDSWQADVHSRLVSLKNDLVGLSHKITDSLTRMNKGTYGKCEDCGKAIEEKRLEAMPTATLCVECSKKAPKRKKR